MAERRMFAKTIIDSDAFLDMPLSTQALYFHLAMRADDEGFVSNPKKIQKMIGASDDDCKLLILKRYILTFESGIVVIKHWKIHNYIQSDRFIEQRTVLLATASAQKEYDGTPLTAHEIIFRTGGLDGHTATANFLSSRTEGGTTQNKIEEGSLRIFDTEGNDVTDNFAYTLKLGWLTILEE